MIRQPANAKGATQKSQVVRSMAWKAPTDGWRTDTALTDMEATSASTLINFFPEPGYSRVRNGCTQWANGMGGNPVQSLMPYSSAAQHLFAGSGGTIWDITAGGAAVSAVSGMSSDYWSSAQTESAAGVFMTCVNPSLVDPPQQFNGGAWYTPEFTSTQYPFAGTVSNANLHLITGISSVTGIQVGMQVQDTFTKTTILPAATTYTITSIVGPAPFTITLSSAATAAASGDTFIAFWPLNFTISGGIIPSGALSTITGVTSTVGMAVGMQIIDFNADQYGVTTPLITVGTTITSITGSAPNYTIGLSAPAEGPTVPIPTTNGTLTSPSYSVYSGSVGLNVVCSYGQRLWFLQQGSNYLYYSDTQAIAGELNSINAGADLRYGGSLVALCPWTAQTINGVLRFLVVLSSEGEALIYQGTNPADDTNWSLLGSFKLSWPLGADRCMYPIGGDVAIMTTDGVVAVSKAIDLDPSASDQGAVTSKITPTWLQTVQNVGQSTFGWQFSTYANSRMAIVNVPDPQGNYQYVMNTETLSWCVFQGMPTAIYFISWNDGLYMASEDGNVYQCDYGNNDNGTPITAYYCGPWQRIVAPFPAIADGISPKCVSMVAADVISDQSAVVSVGASWDYTMTVPALLGTPGQSADWDAADWDSSIWFGETPYRVLGAGLGQGVVYAPTVIAYINGPSGDYPTDCHLLGGATYLQPGSGI